MRGRWSEDAAEGGGVGTFEDRDFYAFEELDCKCQKRSDLARDDDASYGRAECAHVTVHPRDVAEDLSERTGCRRTELALDDDEGSFGVHGEDVNAAGASSSSELAGELRGPSFAVVQPEAGFDCVEVGGDEIAQVAFLEEALWGAGGTKGQVFSLYIVHGV